MVGPPRRLKHGSWSPAKRFAVSSHSDRAAGAGRWRYSSPSVADAFREASEMGGSGGSAMDAFTDRYDSRDPAKWRQMEGHRKLFARPKVAPQAFERDANM